MEPKIFGRAADGIHKFLDEQLMELTDFGREADGTHEFWKNLMEPRDFWKSNRWNPQIFKRS